MQLVLEVNGRQYSIDSSNQEMLGQWFAEMLNRQGMLTYADWVQVKVYPERMADGSLDWPQGLTTASCTGKDPEDIAVELLLLMFRVVVRDHDKQCRFLDAVRDMVE